MQILRNHISNINHLIFVNVKAQKLNDSRDTHIYFYQNIKSFSSFKCDLYCAFTFQQQKNLFKMQETFICLNQSKGK